jgi:uncharacterized protein (DUF433 family)
MSVASPQFSTTLSLTEMEALIRRAVKEAVHEEFARVLRQAPASVVENWTHEGPSNPAGDQLLLAEGLTERERYRTNPEVGMEWGAFNKEMRGKLLARITADPAVLVGKPVIRGMRISVAQIVTAVAAGVPQSELLEDYPGLEPDDIQAALLYAASLVEEERVYPVLRSA